MKLRITSALLAILLALLAFTGCFETDSPDVSTESDIGETSTGETSTPVEPEPKPEPEPEPDFFTKNGVGEMPAESVLPSYCEETETEYLYELPFDSEKRGSYFYNVELEGDYLYFKYWGDESATITYSISSGSKLYEAEYSSDYANGALNDGGLWTVDLETLEVVFFDANGEKRTVRKKTPEPEDGESEKDDNRIVYNAFVSPDGKYMLVEYSKGVTLELYDLESGSKTDVDFYKGKSFTNIVYRDGGFLVRDNNNVLFAVEPETAEVKEIATTDGYEDITYYGGLLLYYSDSALVLGTLDAEEDKFFMAFESGEMLLDFANGCAATYVYGEEKTIRFYDLRNGRIVSEAVIDGDCFIAGAKLRDDGTAIIYTRDEEKARMLIYDLAGALTEEGTPVETIVSTEAKLSEETERIAKETEEKTGIDLLYASEGNDFENFSYLALAETDAFSVYNVVSEAAEILAKYPEGMLRESYADTHKGIKMYLCSSIYGIDFASLDRAGGFTTEKNGYIIVVLDVNEELSRVIPHELSHVFDRRIEYISAQTDTEWMEIWDSATPFDNVYRYTYDEYDRNTKYTIDGESKAERVWFVRNYSRCYPTEDRATLMEVIFNYDDEDNADVYEYENIMYKARLYSYILRQCFTSCDIEGTLQWENKLGVIDESVLPETEEEAA